MKESKLHMKGNVSKSFSTSRKDSNDSKWTSSKKMELQPNIEVITRTKTSFNESLHQMSENYDQKHNARLHERSLNIFVMKKAHQQQYSSCNKNKSYQDTSSPSWHHYMLQKETSQHIQTPSFQNEISNAGGRKEQGLKYISLEQQADRCHVSAYTEQMTRGKKKEPRVLNNDSNHRAHTSFKKKCSISPIPGRFNLNDVEGDLPADFPDFSPLPYEYTNASNKNNDDQTMPHQDCAVAGNDAKRQKTSNEMAANRSQQNSESTTIGLPIFPRRSDHVTFLKEQAYHTHKVCHHDEQSIPQLLKEERKQQHEYLPATLNFPYKDFIASNSKTNESHLQLWCDEEEQSRLEKHFNPKWQVEFFSKFYSSGASLETPDIFGPSKHSSRIEKQEEKDDSTSKNARRNCSISTATATTQSEDEEEDEIIFVSRMTSNTFDSSLCHVQKKQSKDHSNTPQNETSCTSPSSVLEEAAMKLSAAMDDTDKTRDIIARIEKEMQVNRDEILKERMPYFVASSSKNRDK